MGPIRNPNWSTSGMRVTLSYLYCLYIAELRSRKLSKFFDKKDIEQADH